MPIRIKLAVWYGLLTAAVLIVMAVLRFTGQWQIFQDQKDYSLRVTGAILAASISRGTPTPSSIRSAVDRMMKTYPDMEFKGLIIEAYNPSRAILYSSSVTEEERLPFTDEMWARVLRGETFLATVPAGENRRPVRILMKPVSVGNRFAYLLQLGSSMEGRETFLESFVLLNLLIIPTAAVLVGFGGWWLTRRALSPLDSVIQAARRISSGDLGHRLKAEHLGREIDELARAFNQMISRLDVSFQQIRDFNDNVSHELRIPLSILKGETELALRRDRPAPEYRKVLESNLEEINRLEKIVGRLLFLAKAERGEMDLRRAPMSLADITEGVCSQFGRLAAEKKIHVSFHNDGRVIVQGDELLLREVLANLLQNAVNFTPEGGRLSVSVAEPEGKAVLRVSDSGCGIPEDALPRIFERFYQADKSRAGQGSGLGLSLCKRIVEAHEGTIRAESAVGRGSTFTVTLPAGIQAVPGRSDEAERVEPSVASSGL